MKKLFCLCLLLSIFSIAAFADIAPPIKPRPTATPTPEATDAEMFITLSNEVTEPTLHIKKSALIKFAAEFGGAEVTPSAGIGATQNIVGGAFLSLAMVFGGIWFVRGKKSSSKPIAAAMIIFTFGFAGTIIYANIAPPRTMPINRNIFSNSLQGYASASGKIKVKIIDNESGEDFMLFVPKTAAKPN